MTRATYASSGKKTYRELIKLPNWYDRFQYLQLDKKAFDKTFGEYRYLNQHFYRSVEWQRVRDQVIVRDNGCDLGMPGYEIYGSILIHHIIPITLEDIERGNPRVLDLDNLITVSPKTHNAIHYRDCTGLDTKLAERRPFDTCPWIQWEPDSQ